MKRDDFLAEFKTIEAEGKRFEHKLSVCALGAFLLVGLAFWLSGAVEDRLTWFVLAWAIVFTILVFVLRRKFVALQNRFLCPHCHTSLYGYKGAHAKNILSNGKCAKCGGSVLD